MTKKNPFMSMWLSSANAWASALSTELHRQQASMMRGATEQMIRFWTGGIISRPSDRSKNRR
jgi:hypothetical protein